MFTAFVATLALWVALFAVARSFDSPRLPPPVREPAGFDSQWVRVTTLSHEDSAKVREVGS